MLVPLGLHAHLMSHPPLDQAFDVDGAGGESIEAVGEGVLQIVQVKMLGTAPVGPVEKRTVVFVFRHAGAGKPNLTAAP
jgi:hypothetical protein